jgi:hypothetical protein
MSRQEKVFGVFYRDDAHDVAISSANPESLLAARIPALAERLLADPDNFLGIVDRNDAVLQLYLQEDGRVAVELLRSGRGDFLRGRLPLPEVLTLLADLPPVFADDLVPDAERIGAPD